MEQDIYVGRGFSKDMREREKHKEASSRRYPTFCDAKKSDSVLIVGCGDGPQIRVFSKLVKEITAIDIDDERLKLSSELIKIAKIKNTSLLKLSIYELEKLKKKFDLIIIVDVIEHIDEPKKGLLSMKNILAKNGRILLTYPNTFEIYYYFGRILNRYILRIPEKKGKEYDYHKTKQPPWMWNKMIKESGYQIKKINATTMWAPIDWFGVTPFWFTNDFWNAIDEFVCGLPIVKYAGLSMVCVIENE
ncbi:MAG: class I SAM-dependent methyltransferase [archaeon]